MSPSWWQVPVSLIVERTDAASTQFERLMCQIWHFELQTLVNLPFMFLAATDRRYEFPRISCLNACRGLIKRWTLMRDVHSTTFVSNLVEFQAFTAAITLLLGRLGLINVTSDPAVLKERDEDMKIVETVAQILERSKQFGAGVDLINQSISVIRTLQGILRDGGQLSENLRLTIPHFGNINIKRGGSVQPVDGERIVGANPQAEQQMREASFALDRGQFLSIPSASDPAPVRISGSPPQSHEFQDSNNAVDFMNGNGAWMENTVLQFQSSQFPTFEFPAMDSAGEWPFQMGDNFVFGGIPNADMNGTWEL
jgi:hypothetical protein